MENNSTFIVLLFNKNANKELDSLLRLHLILHLQLEYTYFNYLHLMENRVNGVNK